MAYENLLYEVRDRIATVTVNRPKVLNALNRATITELHAAFTGARDDEAVRVVVLTGAGEKAFIAGADVSELHDFAAGGALGGRGALPTLMLGLGKPVIAAVNGYCFGGGFELVYASTLAYAADGAKFAQPEVTLGLNPLWGATQHLPSLVGKKKALEVLLLGEMFDAHEALRLGIINGVVPASELMTRVRSVAANLATKAPIAVKVILDCVRQAGDVTLEQGMDLEAKAFGAVRETEDFIEGTRAFLEKRQAQFRGR
ncbi:MAG: enoyl-CoA hydratase/isomerase family protein [bacterium]